MIKNRGPHVTDEKARVNEHGSFLARKYPNSRNNLIFLELEEQSTEVISINLSPFRLHMGPSIYDGPYAAVDLRFGEHVNQNQPQIFAG